MPPRLKNFHAGSIIYFKDDKADFVFLLKEGKVQLVYNDIQTGEEQIDIITTGEFFGVKSGLIKFPREETAKVIANSTVIEFSSAEFEALITKNTSIILKMLKAFSNQLRRIGKQVQSFVTNKIQTDPESDFFSIGEYYLKNKKYTQAITVYNRYINYYPNGIFAATAKERIKIAQKALNEYGDGDGPAVNLTNPYNAQATISSEDSFIELNNDDVNNQNESFVNKNEGNTSEEERLYNKGLSLMGSNKYGEAYSEFKKILSMNREDIKILAFFEMGKCLFSLKKYEDTIKHFSNFLSKYPKNSEVPAALYYIGNSYQSLGEKQKAMDCYKKVLSLSKPNDNVYRKAEKALKEIK
ncbi:MAG TPA: tetratricopeptide repeat protein [Spirochaetota bacterium]|nr:tetratricopeptide repeat protein [Spirochaetota bacterium]HOL57820.1 tetratricopeptide repeat protein [Spirochaetota bacterium]